MKKMSDISLTTLSQLKGALSVLKAPNVKVPKNLSEFNNDSGYVTEEFVNKSLSQIDTGIPKPTQDDNGKMLQVVNGSAVWTTIGIAEEGSF